jgi:hypothetical protein
MERIHENIRKGNGCEIYNRKVSIDIVKKPHLSTFNKEILLNWNKNQKYPKTPEEIGNQYLCQNENITTTDGKPIFNHRSNTRQRNYTHERCQQQKYDHIRKI